MDGWNTRTFPFGAFRPIFRGEVLVSGRVVVSTGKVHQLLQIFYHINCFHVLGDGFNWAKHKIVITSNSTGDNIQVG